MTNATTKKENPAGAVNANGVNVETIIDANSTTPESRFQELTHCKVCNDRVAWADLHISGLCWRCQQDKDYFADQDEYMALAHGLA